MGIRKTYSHNRKTPVRHYLPVLASFPLLLLLIPFIGRTQSSGDYENRLEEWHRSRIMELRSESGWLNLAGLFWLKEGIQRFGGSDTDDPAFPKGKIPPHAGFFILSGDTVRMAVNEGVIIEMDGLRTMQTVAFHPGMSSPPNFRHGSLAWTVIKRGNLTGIRLRDLDHPALQEFKGVERYPPDTAWRIRARLVRPALQTYIPVTNVLGQTTRNPSPGKVEFELKGIDYTLDALEEGNLLFILFADETNGWETYPSGRFLYASKPGPDGSLELDFNKSINPPCAFTPYATCPLPPAQNRLPLKVEAGERYPGKRIGR
jgi:uncharacterized protein (DUF1684 family)